MAALDDFDLDEEEEQFPYPRRITREAPEINLLTYGPQRHAQQMILLDSFISKFELLLNQNKSSIQIEVIKQLTSLYLTIHQLVTTLPVYQFINNHLDQINILRIEFQAVIDEYLRGIQIEDTPYKDVVDILGIYSIIGDEARAVEILKEKSAKNPEN
ncbi:hypothetical protein BON22_1852 [Cyberlindnera fabianii]|uniref:Uncharacterized protein n=1 Tax=Cyberlindnera fabianii TaxID=36022 RepID=A0A1V2L948_CYBFA|nr:hypothetical protein BON22_1852 [Cyberlindnera fabianii]